MNSQISIIIPNLVTNECEQVEVPIIPDPLITVWGLILTQQLQ